MCDETYKYPWHYPESERMKCVCADCKLPYHEFQDMVVPDFIWKAISPFGDEGGILCPTCIANRLDHIGFWYGSGYYILKDGTINMDGAHHNAFNRK